jgi:hypothetical protein
VVKARAAAVAFLALLPAAGCGDVNTALQHQSEARHLAADLQVQFTKAADAANRAVMATTDEGAQAAARDAEQAKLAVQKNVDALQTILAELKYSDESRLLESFVARFGEYRELDRRILELVVEQTNLKAQRLAFGPAMESAEAMKRALGELTPAASGDAWHVKALAATAVASVREIQAIQSPHIADTEDAAMDEKERRMAAAERAARQALDGLASLVAPASRSRLVTARTALDRFLTLNGELVVLSRRNTNVRSLALTLNEKQKLIAPCEETLRQLREALGKRGYPAGRVPPA